MEAMAADKGRIEVSTVGRYGLHKLRHGAVCSDLS
jgi:hypothetical protein